MVVPIRNFLLNVFSKYLMGVYFTTVCGVVETVPCDCSCFLVWRVKYFTYRCAPVGTAWGHASHIAVIALILTSQGSLQYATVPLSVISVKLGSELS